MAASPINTADVVDSVDQKPVFDLKTHCRRGHPRTPENTIGRGACKPCSAICSKESEKRRRKEDTAAFLVSQLRSNARKRGQEFTITAADILPLPTHCPVLGIKLNYSGKGKKDRSNWPSVDRRDSNIGYLPGNVTVMSYRANRIKGDATVEEIEKLLAWMKRQ